MKKHLSNTFKWHFVILIILTINTSCRKNTTSEIQEGRWSGLLFNKNFIEIPFQFEIGKQGNQYTMLIKNGAENLLAEIAESKNDSIRMIMPYYDSEFIFKNHGDSLSGRWIKHFADYDKSMPFKAAYKSRDLFEKTGTGNQEITGRWKAYFLNAEKTDSTLLIGEFEYNDGIVKGTFLSSTGDYRYLQGICKDRKLFLTGFDGSSANLFTAELSEDHQTLKNGFLHSGWDGQKTWTAKKDPNAELPNADHLTFLKEEYKTIDFTFKNINGEEISLKDEKYKNKVVLVQIMGSWCPNCIDETDYLVPYYHSMKDKGVEIIGLCYERSEDTDIATRNIVKMKERLNIPYELLIAGTNKKGNVNESLPMLKNFIAFPTMIILDKKGEVRRIHTGYSGPATGKHYTNFKNEFETFITNLLSEK